MDPTLTLDEIADIAEEAYVYALPMMIGYGFFHRQVLGPDAPEKQKLGEFTHFRVLAGPNLNNTIPWVNTDTLYSAVWLDLSDGPWVLTTPEFEAHRFQNIQAADWFTMNFLTRGTRDVGNGARRYLLAGPGWEGAQPDGIDETIIADSQIIKLFTRIIVEGEGDVAAINRLQGQYQLERLDDQAAVSPVEMPAPDPAGIVGRGFFEQPRADFIADFNRLMSLARVHPDEVALFDRFARIGAAPGASFDADSLDDRVRTAIQAGIDRARGRIAARLAHLADPVNGWIYPLDLRGDRSRLTGSAEAYLARAVAAKYAIWGPGAEEVVYMHCETDDQGRALDGATGRYEMAFETPPPVSGFWSLTVYDAATRLLVDHPSGRYKRGDRDRDLERDGKGGFVLRLQAEAPSDAPSGNWLPIPERPFQIVGRLYGPSEDIINGVWKPPVVRRL